MLLDTDVLIDLALDRHPYSEPAAALIDRIEATGQTAFIALLAMLHSALRAGGRITCHRQPLKGSDDR